ncbi:MAG: hypothetical protein IKD99_00230 [Erysipelotrichaceae bacterium]|nr:hypothetical protein [Erysipelotrichaceae bacterium]
MTIATVPLKLIVQGLEASSEPFRQYLDIEEMKIVSLPQNHPQDDSSPEELEMSEQIKQLYKKRYFPLPDPSEIDDYRIMRNFVYSLNEGDVKDELESALHGKGAFRRFKSAVHYTGMNNTWYSFRDTVYREIAVKWCQQNNLNIDL